MVDTGVELGPTLDGERAGEGELRGGIVGAGAVEAEGALGVAANFLPKRGDGGIGGEKGAKFVGGI